MKQIDPIKPRYSGALSKEFWKRVGAVPMSGQLTTHNEVYSLGCALQDLESRVLNALRCAEQERKK
jgi:hypothetical protein